MPAKDDPLVGFMCFRFEKGSDKSEAALYVYEIALKFYREKVKFFIRRSMQTTTTRFQTFDLGKLNNSFKNVFISDRKRGTFRHESEEAARLQILNRLAFVIYGGLCLVAHRLPKMRLIFSP